MFDIEMLPAEYGDCLVVTYGTVREPRRILIDGGTSTTFPRLKQYIEALPRKQRRFELLIVTHIDADHIGGVLPLLRDSALDVSFGDIWFNAWRHLAPPRKKGFLGPEQGDLLGNLLSQRPKLPWNERFGGNTVVVPSSGALPQFTLDGDLRLTLLSPRWEELDALNRDWSNKAFKSGRIPGDVSTLGGLDEGVLELLGPPSQFSLLAAERFFPDSAAANGSSIAVLAEYKGKRALLAADAFAPVLLESLQRLPGFSGKLEVDAFKLPHHGSKRNINDELLKALSCRRYLISTSGQRFKHPDASALAKVLKYGGAEAKVFFNYDTQMTRKAVKLLRGRSFRSKNPLEYPAPGDNGMRVSLL
jgi:hypothetical protein